MAESAIKYRYYVMRCWLRGLPDRVAMKVAWLVPRRVAYWCAFRVAAEATTGEYGRENPNDLLFFTMMDRWQ